MNIDIVVTADEFGDGRPTTTVTIVANNVPEWDFTGPSLEYVLLYFVDFLAKKVLGTESEE